MLGKEGSTPASLNSNFNLCFNNSFNTSINQQNKPTLQVDAEHTVDGEVVRHQLVQDLEVKLASQLKGSAGASEEQRLATFNSAFDEVIKQDHHFASLLQKIKDAYSEYLQEIQGKSARQTQLHMTDLQKERALNAQLSQQVQGLMSSNKQLET